MGSPKFQFHNIPNRFRDFFSACIHMYVHVHFGCAVSCAAAVCSSVMVCWNTTISLISIQYLLICSIWCVYTACTNIAILGCHCWVHFSTRLFAWMLSCGKVCTGLVWTAIHNLCNCVIVPAYLHMYSTYVLYVRMYCTYVLYVCTVHMYCTYVLYVCTYVLYVCGMSAFDLLCWNWNWV